MPTGSNGWTRPSHADRFAISELALQLRVSAAGLLKRCGGLRAFWESGHLDHPS